MMLTGDEPLHIGGTPYRDDAFGVADVRDFWRWAYSDLLCDVTRGVLAEFIVARLIGGHLVVSGNPDREFDCMTQNRHTIEVKSSAYLQCWETSKPRGDSNISFSGMKCKLYSPMSGFATEAAYHADLFVFCVLTERDREHVDPLDLTQWQFYVLTRKHLESMRPPPDRLSLWKLRQQTQGFPWHELAKRVLTAEDALRVGG